MVGENLVSQPIAKTAFIVAAAGTAALALILTLIGLFPLIRSSFRVNEPTATAVES
jgi:hypothetical protein